MVNQETQLDRIERKIDKSSLIAWFFGGFALFAVGITFAKQFEDPLSFMALFSLFIAILGCIIITGVFLIWVYLTIRST